MAGFLTFSDINTITGLYFSGWQTFAIDNIDILTIYAQADGSNGIQNIGVAIGTTTASALLFVVGQATDRVSLKVRGESGQTSDLLQLASSTNSNLLIVDKNGKMGIGTSTAEFMLDIYQKDLFLIKSLLKL